MAQPLTGVTARSATPARVIGEGPRADYWAAALTVLGGAIGVAQLWVSWTSIVPGVGLPGADGGLTGWELFRTARTGASLSLSGAIAAYSVVGVAVLGGALVLLGLAMLAPLNHRPLGAVGLILSVLSTAAAAWWLLRSSNLMGQTLSEVFAHAGPGWYLFLLAGPIGVAGSTKALVTG